MLTTPNCRWTLFIALLKGVIPEKLINVLLVCLLFFFFFCYRHHKKIKCPELFPESARFVVKKVSTLTTKKEKSKWIPREKMETLHRSAKATKRTTYGNRTLKDG